MFAPIERVVAWLREGYPQGIPSGDYIPLVAVLRRRLSDDEIRLVGTRLERAGLLADESHVGAELLRVTHEVPAPDEIHRVAERLRSAGLDIVRPDWERPDAPVVHLLYGLQHSGKSALARAIEEEEDAVRFSLEEWLGRLYPEAGPGDRVRAERAAAVRSLMRDVAAATLRAGLDVVFDWNAWSREQRAWAVGLADETGAVVLVHALSAGVEEIERRRAGRDPRADAEAVRSNRNLAAVMEPVAPDERVRLVTH